jgi:hypothetical protein
MSKSQEGTTNLAKFSKRKKRLKYFCQNLFASLTTATAMLPNKKDYRCTKLQCITEPIFKWYTRSKVILVLFTVFLSMGNSPIVGVTSGHLTGQTAKRNSKIKSRRASLVFSYYLAMKQEIHSCRHGII